MKVSVKETEVNVTLAVGADLTEAVALIGEEKVHELYVEAAERHGAHLVKRYIRKGWAEERIAGAMEEWTPASVVKKITDPVAKMQKAFEKLSEEEKELFRASF